MTVLVKQKSDPGRQYVFDNVASINVVSSYNSKNECTDINFMLVSNSGEVMNNTYNSKRYDLYKKFEFNEIDDGVSEVDD